MPSANARTMHSERLAVAVVAIAAVGSLAASAGEIATGLHRSIEELTPTATIRVGKTADWVAEVFPRVSENLRS